MELLNIPNDFKINTVIPKEKFILPEMETLYNSVCNIIWTGRITSSMHNVKATITDKLRYEEIEFFQVTLKRRDSLYEIGKSIYSRIKYPCVIEFIIDDAIVIGVCEFQAGKINFSDNVKKKIRFSHILRKELLSQRAQTMIDNINVVINSVINQENSIGNIYNKICNEVMNYCLSGTSSIHVKRLIANMIGKTSSDEQKRNR